MTPTPRARCKLRLHLLLPLLIASAHATAQAPTTPAPAQGTPAKTLVRQANDAYGRKGFAASAKLFGRAIEAGDRSANTYYNAACSFALAGQKDRALKLLELATDAGLAGIRHLQADTDLVSLHDDPRWSALVARIKELHPEEPLLELLQNQRLPVPATYFPVRRALADGLRLPNPDASPFQQYYATAASMMGEYDEAHAHYGADKRDRLDPVKSGFTRAVPANALVLQMARGRQAVLLNESHADAQTRAANYLLLAGLRKEGFEYLALETLAAPPLEPGSPDACAAPKLHDAALPKRGYPVKDSGYYTKEPVFGEIVREALRLGFVLLSYDGGGNNAAREQHQADMLSCVFKTDPKARLVVIAGFAHISENPDQSFPGGVMGYRFRQATGIDPLTVNMSSLVRIDPAGLQFPAGDAGRGAQAYALTDAKGVPYGGNGYDLLLHVRAPAHRNDGGGSWLELGGARRPTPIDLELCHGKLPCLIEARAEGESADSTPSDRCVIGDAAVPGCTLYLRPGSYEITFSDEKHARLGALQRRVNQTPDS